MRKLAITVVVVAVVGVAAFAGLRSLTGRLHSLIPQAEDCTATVSGHQATLDPEQAANAALITALSVRRGLPARAATIALATAMQESKLYNLEGGDRDSLGLFQQRPSQGWGTRSQVLDPVHATDAFYDALVKIPNYENLKITVAAQKVQRSAYPAAYAKHEPDARALASALTGYSPHAFACRIDVPDTGAGHPAALRKEIGSLFDGVVDAPVVRGSTATIGVPSATAGWAVAHYVVAEAQRLGVLKVSYAGWTWSTGKDGDWKHTGSGSARQVTVTFA
ncbi:hypothetical protein P5P86_06430 [Nocardioides sp. BP30]|uniref:hypothetical protein n=1 Tax=Nocardioides sp. BP30 TaxID=3036374 RepID=UPI0024697F5E|nr:hypothetical protein [Nocardioides sp. BP30]WGL53464.1 hypothetical protein P5P86_06430 [Nocardioides sp. BP30]